MKSNAVLLTHAENYAKSRDIVVKRQHLLGHGSDGAVWLSSRDTAIKILDADKSFRIELECYRRLKEANVREICGLAVPFLEDWDESLKAIEMTTVDPPYLLDFGKVYVDVPPPYYADKQMMAATYAEWRERFGADWVRVPAILNALKIQFRIYYIDPRPSNICFGHEADEEDDTWMRECQPEPGDANDDSE